MATKHESVDMYIDKVEEIAQKLSSKRWEAGEEDYPRQDIYPCRPLRYFVTFMCPSNEWIDALRNASKKAIALALLNNADDMDAMKAINEIIFK